MKVWQPTHGTRKYAHFKYDGHCIIIKRGATVKFLTRSMLIIDLSFLPVSFEKVPPNTTLYAELWAPGKPASAVSTGIAERDKSMRLSVFSLPQMEPSRGLEWAHGKCFEWGLEFIPWYISREYATVSTAEKHLGCMGIFEGDPRKIAIPTNCEGFVLKNSQGDLNPLKVKAELTADLIVTGFTPGKGKYAGQVGSMQCMLYGGTTTIADVGGMTDAERLQISSNVSAYIGKVCEVKYQYVGAGGRLRHPRFVRWRDDKPADECRELT